MKEDIWVLEVKIPSKKEDYPELIYHYALLSETCSINMNNLVRKRNFDNWIILKYFNSYDEMNEFLVYNRNLLESEIWAWIEKFRR